MNASNISICLEVVSLMSKDLSDFKTLLVAFMSFDVILSFLITLANGLLIVAIRRSPNLKKPSYLLIASLALADLLIGLVLHPVLAFQYLVIVKRNYELACVLQEIVLVITFHFVLVSLIHSLCISIDRHLAVLLGSRYNAVVKRTRVRLVVKIIWFAATVITIALKARRSVKNITFIRSLPLVLVGLIALLLPTCIFYIVSFILLYKQKKKVTNEFPASQQFKIRPYIYVLKTMLVIFGFLLLRFVPLIVTIHYIITVEISTKQRAVVHVSFMCFGVGGIISPLIYWLRFRDLRQACWVILKNCIGF